MLEKLRTKTYSQNPDEREAQVKSDLLKSRLIPEQNRRPSVEASVHHAIKYKFVIHMHPTYVNAVMCAKNAESVVQQLFGDEVVFIPYITPGFILYQEIENQNDKYFNLKGRYPQVFFLQNHGVFVGAETTEEVKEKYTWILESIKAKITNWLEIADVPVDDGFTRILPAVRAALSVAGLKLARVRNNILLQSFLEHDEKMQHLANPFTPDGIVFCGARPLVVERFDSVEDTLNDFKVKLADFRKNSGYDPKIVVIRGLGVIAPADNINAVDIALDVFEDVLKIAHYSLNFGGPNFMEPEHVRFIEEWTDEAGRLCAGD
jgi:rhamnose utilization protein RhaD (predicted bifunctional aldolase and dehydrogenase)